MLCYFEQAPKLIDYGTVHTVQGFSYDYYYHHYYYYYLLRTGQQITCTVKCSETKNMYSNLKYKE